VNTMHHLLRKEGIDGMAGVDNSESCWKSRRLLARSGAARKLATGFGD
jgi:coenzyme F420-reducing hydrogenase beta subunit